VRVAKKGAKKAGPTRAAKLTPPKRGESIGKFDEIEQPATTFAPADASDHAMLEILRLIKATNDQAEIRKLSAQLERVVFHKQYHRP
jgi:hypothetical protein